MFLQYFLARSVGAAHAHLGATGAKSRRFPDRAGAHGDVDQRALPPKLLQRRQRAGRGLRRHRGRGLHQTDGEQADAAQVAGRPTVQDVAALSG